MQYVYAHRGASGYAPENTLKAFDLAADMHAYGVELDVQRTRDGVLVVFHDETVDRVTDGHGRIADMTLAELRKLRVCKPLPEVTDQVIPTLEEVYTLLHDRGLYCNAELKNSVIFYENLEAEAMEMAAKTGMSDRLLYSSFNHYSMRRVKQLDCKARAGLLYGGVLLYEPWAYAVNMGVDALHPHFAEPLRISDEITCAHRRGIEVNPWTVNTEVDLQTVIAAGADRIITNYPDRALAILNK